MCALQRLARRPSHTPRPYHLPPQSGRPQAVPHDLFTSECSADVALLMDILYLPDLPLDGHDDARLRGALVAAVALHAPGPTRRIADLARGFAAAFVRRAQLDPWRAGGRMPDAKRIAAWAATASALTSLHVPCPDIIDALADLLAHCIEALAWAVPSRVCGGSHAAARQLATCMGVDVTAGVLALLAAQAAGGWQSVEQVRLLLLPPDMPEEMVLEDAEDALRDVQVGIERELGTFEVSLAGQTTTWTIVLCPCPPPRRERRAACPPRPPPGKRARGLGPVDHPGKRGERGGCWGVLDGGGVLDGAGVLDGGGVLDGADSLTCARRPGMASAFWGGRAGRAAAARGSAKGSRASPTCSRRRRGGSARMGVSECALTSPIATRGSGEWGGGC